MKYDEIKDFIKKVNISKSKLYRFYNKNEDLYYETKLRKNRRLIPIDHQRYFDSEIMYDENKVLRLENSSMRNLIDCLVDKDSLKSRLWYMDWSFFMTVAYKTERNKKSCFRQMNAMYEGLIEEYGDETSIRLFFTTEPFTNRKGYHNHFVLYIKKKSLHEEVIKFIKKFFNFDRVDFGKYDKYQAGLFYMAKKWFCK